jgi:hypothetical protein
MHYKFPSSSRSNIQSYVLSWNVETDIQHEIKII